MAAMDSVELFSSRADSDDGDYEYEQMTSVEVLQRVEEAWHNEKLAPDLLPHKSDFVSSLLEQIKANEEMLEQQPRTDILTCIQKLELDRIKFIICSYLRTRIQKIEKYVWHLLKQESSNENDRQILSPDELTYATEYARNLDAHFHALVLKNVPTNLQEIDQKKAIPKPDMSKYVFIKGINRQENVPLDPSDDSLDGETITIDPGSQFMLPYLPIADLVKNGDVSIM